MTSTVLALIATLAGSGIGSEGAALQGSVASKSFQPTQVWLRKLGENTVKNDAGKILDRADAYILEFRTGQDFFPNEAIEVWFTVDTGRKLSQLALLSKSHKFGTPEYSRQHYKSSGSSVGRGINTVSYGFRKPGDSMPDMEMVLDEIACQIQFKGAANGRISGYIDLKLPKHPKVWIKGSFSAHIKS